LQPFPTPSGPEIQSQSELLTASEKPSTADLTDVLPGRITAIGD
jgi:hypothetical protein